MPQINPHAVVNAAVQIVVCTYMIGVSGWEGYQVCSEEFERLCIGYMFRDRLDASVDDIASLDVKLLRMPVMSIMKNDDKLSRLFFISPDLHLSPSPVGLIALLLSVLIVAIVVAVAEAV
ncbi:hypothetical protein GIB67_035418 [Kingdonia uniflora]|uniref:Uncharacterized protein n=1 Tax=Kingdonia uniflora TaxID=39325 RepID=A0A7J7P0Z5_9MAGN|nr:hypothetical protein GIB67_035418 [Kingdonia uniflora]